MAVLFIAASSFAQSACPTAPAGFGNIQSNDFNWTKGSPLTTIDIAVASNYYCPAVRMVYNFLQSNIDDVKVKVHHNSTGTLIAEIENNSTTYDFLFTADAIPGDLVDFINEENYDNLGVLSEEVDAFLYAGGEPVLFGYNSNAGGNMNNVHNLMNNIPTTVCGANSTSCTIGVTGAVLKGLNYIVAQNAKPVAIAVTPAAPYGTAAVNILGDLNAPTTVAGPFNNIATTYNNVGTSGIPTGIVSKAQICGNLADVTYIGFNGYMLRQEAVQITDEGQPLMDWIIGEMGNGGSNSSWNQFLDLHCYGKI